MSIPSDFLQRLAPVVSGKKLETPLHLITSRSWLCFQNLNTGFHGFVNHLDFYKGSSNSLQSCGCMETGKPLVMAVNHIHFITEYVLLGRQAAIRRRRWSWRRRTRSEGEYGDDDGEGDRAELIRWSSNKYAEGGDGGASGGIELYQKDNMDDDGEGDCRTDQISMEVG
ncbi:hypothetical protein NE237_001920 [Protea cynaroides]|uniref:Uncharacterized protein n=1 Tax=Protea cynaroides TaxID=273540 RepID=A0A9Q0QYW5_9MAGN|nr:hypothetical protein NE237_001920 [Protea cynaroides]